MKSIAFSILAMTLTGCASMLNDARQEVRVETQSANGEMVAGAQCTLRNAREVLQNVSGSSVAVHRSADDLFIECRHPDFPVAHARAISRMNKEMAGNAFFLFGLGATLDHKLGKGYSYPSWLKLVFGENLRFDRRDEKDGEPVPAQRDDGSAQ